MMLIRQMQCIPIKYYTFSGLLGFGIKLLLAVAGDTIVCQILFHIANSSILLFMLGYLINQRKWNKTKVCMTIGSIFWLISIIVNISISIIAIMDISNLDDVYFILFNLVRIPTALSYLWFMGMALLKTKIRAISLTISILGFIFALLGAGANPINMWGSIPELLINGLLVWLLISILKTQLKE